MSISIPTAESFASVDSKAVLRALSSRSFLSNPDNSATLERLNTANKEMDRAGSVGLSVSFSEVKMREAAEGIWGKWFGASSEFYVVTTAIDGSGKVSDYKTQFFEGLERDDDLPLGDGGMLVSYMENPRWFVDLHMIVMESDSDLRQLGQKIDEAKQQTGLNEVLELVGTAAAFDPTLVSQVTSGVDLFLSALVHGLKANGDDHVATIHDFYLKHQAFGKGRHPKEGTKRFQGVEVAYDIELTEL